MPSCSMKPNFLERRKIQLEFVHGVHFLSVYRFDGFAKGSADSEAYIAPQVLLFDGCALRSKASFRSGSQPPHPG